MFHAATCSMTAEVCAMAPLRQLIFSLLVVSISCASPQARSEIHYGQAITTLEQLCASIPGGASSTCKDHGPSGQDLVQLVKGLSKGCAHGQRAESHAAGGDATASQGDALPSSSRLSPEGILSKYGSNTPLTASQLQEFLSALVACQADPRCTLGSSGCSRVHEHGHDDHEHAAHDDDDHDHDHQGHYHHHHGSARRVHGHGHSHGHSHHAHRSVISVHSSGNDTASPPASGPSLVTGYHKVAAGGVLFLEAVAGMFVPVLFKRTQRHQWWMGLLNCFSGGIFLAAGLMHLLPHCAEAQQAVLPGSEYPLHLLLVVAGYLLVFFIERVLFDVHGEGHAHGHDDHQHGSHCQHGATHWGLPVSHAGSRHVSDDGDKQDVADQRQTRRRGSARSQQPGATDSGEMLHEPLLPGAAGGAAGAAAGSCPGHTHDHYHEQEHQHHTNTEAGGHEEHDAHGHAHAHVHEPVSPHVHGEEAEHHHHQPKTLRLVHALVLLLAMTVHTSLECLALGFIAARRDFLVLFVAIASHKAISALALSARFMREGASLKQVIVYVGPFCLVAPTSILLGSLLGGINPAVHLVLSGLATGTFLYVGCSEVLLEEYEGDVRCGRRDISAAFARYTKFGMVLLAVGMIALLGLLPHGHDD